MLGLLLVSAAACAAPRQSAPPVVQVDTTTPAARAAPAAADTADTSYVGAVSFDLASPGALVVLVCEKCRPAQRKMIPRFPVRVKFADPEERWQLRATKAGFSDYVEDIKFERGTPEKSITIRLVPTIQARL